MHAVLRDAGCHRCGVCSRVWRPHGRTRRGRGTDPLWLLAAAAACAGALAGTAAGERPAFPGAEGFGATTTGGRGGRVIHVTALEPSGPGSLQAACDAEGPRIVVFDVAGAIVPPNVDKGRRYLAIRHGRITIAGQTAPGAGVTVEGMISTLRGAKDKPLRDVVIRFLRIRPSAAREGGRNLRALELSNSERIVVDHVSGSWSIDDCFDLYTAREATVQWCAAEESDIWLEGGDEPHNFGMITGYGGPRPITVHHTLLANHRERTPACGSYPTDFRNNVIYNSGGGMGLLVRAGYADGFAMNVVGNYVRGGPGGIIGHRIYLPPRTVATGALGPYRRGLGRFFLDGNCLEPAGGYVRPWRTRAAARSVVDRPFDFPAVTTHPAGEAFERVLAASGCLPRDAVSRRTVREVLTRTGCWGRRGPGGGLMEGLRAGEPPPDTDRDGMPDAWETRHGLDPGDPSDAKRTVPKGASRGDRHAGYTYVEFYLNELADTLVAKALTAWRLNPPPARPWDRPARGLSPMASPHASLDEILAALADQDRARQLSPDPRVKYATAPAWFAVQQLSRMGAKAAPAVPKLRKLLDTDDTRRAAFAAWALGAIGPPARDAAPGLVAALEKDWKVAGGKWTWSPVGFAAWALGRIGPEARSSVPALTRLLAGGTHPRAVEPALYALSRMGPSAEPAMAVLLKRVEHPHAQEALANIGAPAVAALTKALADGGAEVRIGAIRALGRMGPKARPAAGALVELLKDEHSWVRAWSAWALGRMEPSPRSVGALTAALGDADMNVRHRAAAALGACGASASPALRPLGRALRSDASQEVRAAAGAALGKIGPASRAVLAEALAGDPSPFVRRCAARALGEIGPAAGDALVRALGDGDAEVRREAAWALGRIGPPSAKAAAALRKARDDADYVVAVAAAAALRSRPSR